MKCILFLSNDFSFVGKLGRRSKPLTLGGGCWYDRTIAHEFIHAWGFNHEQTRPDRDNYVEIKWGNIMRGTSFNFNKETNSLTSFTSSVIVTIHKRD